MNKLKEELKQNKPFPSLEEEVFLNLQRTAFLLRDKVLEILGEHELNDIQYNVLRILRGAGEQGIVFEELEKRLLFTNEKFHQFWTLLESRGLIIKENLLYDNSAFKLKISELGLKLLEKLDEPIIAINKTTLGHLGDSQLMTLNELLVLARKKV